MSVSVQNTFRPSGNDVRLIREAIARLRKSDNAAVSDETALFDLLAGELNRGRRDMFSLIRAGQRHLAFRGSH